MQTVAETLELVEPFRPPFFPRRRCEQEKRECYEKKRACDKPHEKKRCQEPFPSEKVPDTFSSLFFSYDAWDRLVEVRTAREGGTRLARYTYDALGRRVCETAGNPDAEKLCAVTAGTRRDFYHTKDWQVAEERLGGAVQAHYVWSLAYVDGLVLRDRDTADTNPDLDERLYVQQDANWNVTAVVSTAGIVVERFVYDPYGQPTVLQASWATYPVGQEAGAYAWLYLHQGGRYFRFDVSSGTYHFRYRELFVTLGRWEKPDPIGFEAGDSNLYRHNSNNPLNRVDPDGLTSWIIPTSPAWIKKCEEHCAAKGQVSAGPITTQHHYDMWIYKYGWQATDCNCRPKPKDCGDCTPQELAYLQAAKDVACNGAREPHRSWTCDRLLVANTKNRACVAARLAISTKCFPGEKTNPAHRRELNKHAEWLANGELFYRIKCLELALPIPLE